MVYGLREEKEKLNYTSIMLSVSVQHIFYRKTSFISHLESKIL